MSQQTQLDVSKWQASRRKFLYTPVLWFYYRMIEVAFLDARATVNGKPTDAALLGRDWIARSEPVARPANAPALPWEYVDFPECCRMLGLNPDVERTALLEMIDRAIETDDDECWARLEVLSASEQVDDVEPLFDAPRVVPALDQLTLFALDLLQP
jgi:hypothetical protein